MILFPTGFDIGVKYSVPRYVWENSPSIHTKCIETSRVVELPQQHQQQSLENVGRISVFFYTTDIFMAYLDWRMSVDE